MSFRSRSHTKPVAPPRRRSSSLTRNGGTSNGYSTASSARPFSVHGSTLSSFPSSSQGSSYLYGSNQNLRIGSSDYYGNGAAGNDYRRGSYTTSNGSMKFPAMNTSNTSAYTSPYKDRYASSSSYGSNGTSGYTSAYKDRGYYNPYTSYDNGVTTASLSIPSSTTSKKRDYTPMRSSNMMSTSTSGLGGSSTNLMGNSQSINETVANIGRSQSLREHERKSRSRRCQEAVKAAVKDTTGPYDASSGLGSSLSTANKSLSSLSLHSEGYEVIRWCFLLLFWLNLLHYFLLIKPSKWLTFFSSSLLVLSLQSGNESRSRAESLASNALGDTNDDGEFIDYKALYEAAK